MTCIGFTRDALKFAKAKGITPVVMRLFEDSDLAGRIVRSVVNMLVRSPGDSVLSLFVGDNDLEVLERARKQAGITNGVTWEHDVYFELPDGTRRHFLEVMQESMNEAMGDRKDGVPLLSIHRAPAWTI